MKPGDVVRWFRGSSGVVLEGRVDRLADEELQIFGDQGPLWVVTELRTFPSERAWPTDDGSWNVTEAEMRFERVRGPYRTLEEARLLPPVFDEGDRLVAGGCLSRSQ